MPGEATDACGNQAATLRLTRSVSARREDHVTLKGVLKRGRYRLGLGLVSQLTNKLLRGGGGWMGQRAAGTKPHWMGIYDDHNRLMVAMTYNNDVGDSWELADDPNYPERFSALGIRLGINYVVYSMTH